MSVPVVAEVIEDRILRTTTGLESRHTAAIATTGRSVMLRPRTAQRTQEPSSPTDLLRRSAIVYHHAL
jgi:hypothetical protein